MNIFEVITWAIIMWIILGMGLSMFVAILYHICVFIKEIIKGMKGDK